MASMRSASFSKPSLAKSRVPLWRKQGLIAPHSPAKKRWDTLMRCCALYCTLIIPCVSQRGGRVAHR